MRATMMCNSCTIPQHIIHINRCSCFFLAFPQPQYMPCFRYALSRLAICAYTLPTAKIRRARQRYSLTALFHLPEVVQEFRLSAFVLDHHHRRAFSLVLGPVCSAGLGLVVSRARHRPRSHSHAVDKQSPTHKYRPLAATCKFASCSLSLPTRFSHLAPSGL